MDFTLTCDCGKQQTVNEGTSGSKLNCACGCTIKIPSLHILREQAGLTGVKVHPAAVVAEAITQGRLPPPKCVNCDNPHGRIVRITTECERSWKRTRSSRGIGQVILVLFSWGLYLISTFGEDKDVEIQGRDLIVETPVSLCTSCWGFFRRVGLLGMKYLVWVSLVIGLVLFVFLPNGSMPGKWLLVFGIGLGLSHRLLTIRRQRRFKKLLRTIPEYCQLLDDYPSATIEIPVT
jgi:hypothetical protein